MFITDHKGVKRMGGKNSGRFPIFNDEYHKVAREVQKKYDKEIKAIREEFHCSFKEAQRIRRDRKKKKLKQEA